MRRRAMRLIRTYSRGALRVPMGIRMDIQKAVFDDELLTPQQVSAILQIPQSTLGVWRSTGRVKLPFVKVGHAVRYRRSALDRMLSNGSRT
jgi:hypothetical protein